MEQKSDTAYQKGTFFGERILKIHNRFTIRIIQTNIQSEDRSEYIFLANFGQIESQIENFLVVARVSSGLLAVQNHNREF